jgi:glycosyltransferase involved in cell wall biosynthesis
MKGILFVENYIAGGSDRIAHSLLTGLAFSRLTVMVNRGNDTRILFGQNLPSHVVVDHYGLVTIPELVESARGVCSAPVRMLARMAEWLFRYPLFLLSILYFRRRIASTGANVFIANNGGFPGANYCRSATIAAALVPGMKVFHIVHGMAVPAHGFSPGQWLTDRLIDRFSRIVTICQATAVQLKKVRSIKQAPEVILNGIEPKIINPPTLAGTTLRILHMGYFDRNKNQAMLIRAVAELDRRGVRNLSVRFVGADPVGGLAHQCRQLAVELGVADRVWFDDFSDEADECYRDADVFVLCSYREGLSVAILEAMRAGLPVIATNVGGVEEQVVDDASGYLVAPDDHVALAERIARLVLDSNLRKRFGLTARSIFEQKFTRRTMLSRYADLFGVDVTPDLAPEQVVAPENNS